MSKMKEIKNCHCRKNDNYNKVIIKKYLDVIKKFF